MTKVTPNGPGARPLAQLKRFRALEDILMGFSDGVDGDRLQAGLTWAKTGRADWRRQDLISLFAAPWVAAQEEAGWEGNPTLQGEMELDEITAAALQSDSSEDFVAKREAGEIDLYDDKVQAGIAWTMRQWGEALGLKAWTQGDGSESVEGDVGAEIHTILVDAGLRDPETNKMAALRVQPQASANDQLTADEAWSDLLDKDDRTSPEDQPGMCLITAGELADYMARARPQPVALPLEDAPRDGTMLRLRVRYEAANQDEAWTPLEDSEESWTIGFNNFDNTGDDRWQFVGWDWSQDHLLEATGGAVIGWLPFHTHPAPAPEGGAVDGWRAIDSAPIGELVQVYWPCMALNDDGELTGEMLDREGHVSLSFRHSEKHGWEPDSVIEANGDGLVTTSSSVSRPIGSRAPLVLAPPSPPARKPRQRRGIEWSYHATQLNDFWPARIR